MSGTYSLSWRRIAQWLDIGADFRLPLSNLRLTGLGDRFVGKPCHMCQPTRPTQLSIRLGSVNE